MSCVTAGRYDLFHRWHPSEEKIAVHSVLTDLPSLSELSRTTERESVAGLLPVSIAHPSSPLRTLHQD
jgi:hypothetical protein